MNGSEFDYGSDGIPPPPTNEALAEISALVDKAVAAEAEIQKMTEELQAKNAALTSLLENVLPEKMKLAGLQEFKLTSGLSVTIVEDIRTSLSEERRDGAMDWLEQNGQGSVIKRNVTASFNKGQEEMAKKVEELIRQTFPATPIVAKRDVHFQTLRSLLKELLRKGVNVPKETFALHQFSKAKIK
jgi:hypothetical protein